jgi:uncharacterized protein (DUF4415 family)
MTVERIRVERHEIPAFASEAEETDYWDTHELAEHIWDEEAQSMEELHPELAEQLEQERQRRAATAAPSSPRARSIAVRFDADVLERLRVLAARKETGYQTLLKLFVTERLYEEEKREGII